MSDQVCEQRKKRGSTLDFIRKHAGTMSSIEMAAVLYCTENSVRGMASKAGISLKLGGKPHVSNTRSQTAKGTQDSETQLEEYSRVLRKNGWTVIRPDPFLQLAHKRQGARQ